MPKYEGIVDDHDGDLTTYELRHPGEVAGCPWAGGEGEGCGGADCVEHGKGRECVDWPDAKPDPLRWCPTLNEPCIGLRCMAFRVTESVSWGDSCQGCDDRCPRVRVTTTQGFCNYLGGDKITLGQVTDPVDSNQCHRPWSEIGQADA